MQSPALLPTTASHDARLTDGAPSERIERSGVRRRRYRAGGKEHTGCRLTHPDSVASCCRPDGGFELSVRAPAGTLGRSVHFVRGTPVQFAAMLPGDGVVETVLTGGLSSFL